MACGTVPSEAAHVRNGTDGGMGMKPSDCWVVPLCHIHHAYSHNVGDNTFEEFTGFNMRHEAIGYWVQSPHFKLGVIDV